MHHNMASLSCPTPPKLILHFDVNETILLVDAAGGDTFEDCLNKIICKTALVSTTTSDDPLALPTHWGDGQPIESKHPPPLCTDFVCPEGTSSYYRYNPMAKAQSSRFTEQGQPGAQYRSLYNELETAVRWYPKGHPKNDSKPAFWDDDDSSSSSTGTETTTVPPPDPRLSHDGIHHFLLPAFFHTITELKRRNRSFTIVIRTFGTDMDDVVKALEAYSEGKHLPRFNPVVEEMATCKHNTWKGQYNREQGTFQLTKQEATPSGNGEDTVVLTHEKDISRVFQGDGTVSCVACTDDYAWWKQHHYSPSAGKPLFVTRAEENMHEIFFDDNIHNDPNDSIVAVRVRKEEGKEGKDGESESGWYPLNGHDTLSMQGVHLVKVPTIAPVLNVNYFLEQIDKCEANYLASTATKAIKIEEGRAKV
jgi:hypothetical protein